MGKRHSRKMGRSAMFRAAAVLATAIGATSAVMNGGNVNAETVNTKAEANIQVTWPKDPEQLHQDRATDFGAFKYGTLGWFALYYNNKKLTGVVGIEYGANIDPASGKLTAYVPIWYLMNMMQTQMGIQSKWDGHNWYITLPQGMQFSMPAVQPTNDPKRRNVYVNGVCVETPYAISAYDISSGYKVMTTWFPLWYAENLLDHISGTNTIWDVNSQGWYVLHGMTNSNSENIVSASPDITATENNGVYTLHLNPQGGQDIVSDNAMLTPSEKQLEINESEYVFDHTQIWYKNGYTYIKTVNFPEAPNTVLHWFIAAGDVSNQNEAAQYSLDGGNTWTNVVQSYYTVNPQHGGSPSHTEPFVIVRYPSTTDEGEINFGGLDPNGHFDGFFAAAAFYQSNGKFYLLWDLNI